MNLNIFDIQRFTIHDGPGIRTTLFMKGCPLHCAWCHNPESINPKTQELFRKELCIGCGICQIKNNIITECPTGARWTAGYEISIDDVMKELIKDKVYYEKGGGVTICGGEPLLQWTSVKELIFKLKEHKIHTAVDTCCYARQDIIKDLSLVTDLVIADFKLFTKEKHIEMTGVDNELILNAIHYLNSIIPEKLWISIPIIPGIHNEEELLKMSQFLNNLKNISKVRLIPYDEMGHSKYTALGLKPTMFKGNVEELLSIAANLLKSDKIILMN